jgi:hypothetical protein
MKLDLATDRNVKKILLLASCLISAKCFFGKIGRIEQIHSRHHHQNVSSFKYIDESFLITAGFSFDHNLPTNEKHNVAIPFSQAEYVFGVAY